MPRVKRGVTARAKHKKVFEFTKGHRGRRKNVYRVATQSMDKALQYAYRDSCLLYTSPSPRDATLSRMPSSA